MTRIATLGTSSCATIAIAHFKEPNKALNDAYIADPKSFKEPASGMTVAEFSSSILYPVSQPLGHTKEYPFEKLMEDLAKSGMSSKLVMATLNQSQFMGNDHYWPKQLKKHGFKLIHKAGNNWGQPNYMFMRSPSESVLTAEEQAVA